MELYYNLLNLYAKNSKDKERAEDKINLYIDDEFLEETDVVDIATECNTVIFVEVEQDDGYAESILVDNTGKVKERLVFSLEHMEEIRVQILNEGLDSYFTKRIHNRIIKEMASEELELEDFLDEYLSSYIYDMYDQKKEKVNDKIDKYFK